MKEECVELKFYNTKHSLTKEYLIRAEEVIPDEGEPFGESPFKDILENKDSKWTIDVFLDTARQYGADSLCIRAIGITDEDVHIEAEERFDMDCRGMSTDELFDRFMDRFAKCLDKGFKHVRHVAELYSVANKNRE